jgi:predicted RNase H-like nuclease (RuvC/YqgF family)
MGRQDDPNQLPNPAPELNIPEGEANIEEAKPLPKYESIEELMKEIEHGTNEAAHKYKMDEMKRVYEALEAKVGSLEEGEHAEHIDQKAVKQMRKDIATLRKAEEKLRKEFDKKFSGKEKKETPAKEKAVEALQEGFNLRKFLAENRK